MKNPKTQKDYMKDGVLISKEPLAWVLGNYEGETLMIKIDGNRLSICKLRDFLK